MSAAFGDLDEPTTHLALMTHYRGAQLVAGMVTDDFLGVVDQMDSLGHLIDHG